MPLVRNFSFQTGDAAMADLSTLASEGGFVQQNGLAVKSTIALALAVLADWLFYEHGVGISAVIFAIALACGSLLTISECAGKVRCGIFADRPAIERSARRPRPCWRWRSASACCNDRPWPARPN
jgi:hypothetical protein